MGNCQTAEAAAAVIEHPEGPTHKVERIYWPINAHEVMSSNPGHYVARLVMTPPTPSNPATSVRLKLLRPTDTLHLGNLYRLIRFEDLVKEFASSKKSVNLGKLRGNRSSPQEDMGGPIDPSTSDPNPDPDRSPNPYGNVSIRLGHWKPTLQSIAETGN